MIAEIVKQLAELTMRGFQRKISLTSQASASGPVSQGVQAAESPKAPVCVIEAGTGTGKTLAYFWPQFHCQALNLKVVMPQLP